MKKYAIITVIICIAAYIGMNFASGSQTLLQQTTEFNTNIYNSCFVTWQLKSTGSDTDRYRTSTDCWKSKRKLTSNDLYLTVPKYLVDEKKCSISQTEDEHVRPERWGMYATDIACNFKEQGVYAPDYLDEMKEYTIEATGSDNLLGSFVILSFKDNMVDSNIQQWRSRWYFGHTILNSGLKIGDTIVTWVRFAYADLSGATTGWHTHIELRRMYDGVWQSIRYVTRAKERKLEEKRLWIWWSSSWKIQDSNGWSIQKSIDTYYFTHYDLWDTKQNDSSPCVSADGKDSCTLGKTGRWTMALTVDVRKKLGIVFGDKVALTGDVGCEGVYTVTDEMACRFRGENAWSNGPCAYKDWTPTPRISNIPRPWTPYFIKWDLPGRPGWACSIRKL